VQVQLYLHLFFSLPGNKEEVVQAGQRIADQKRPLGLAAQATFRVATTDGAVVPTATQPIKSTTILSQLTHDTVHASIPLRDSARVIEQTCRNPIYNPIKSDASAFSVVGFETEIK